LALADLIDGIVLLDKPSGLSSNAALQQVKRIFRARKAGHGGSLDPLASGMLPICLGEATKLAGPMLAGRKCYEFQLQLGVATTTGDLEGEVIAKQAAPALTSEGVQAALTQFIGRREQVPPMHSALRHKGERLYELARRGIEIERAPRPIEIESFDLLALDQGRLTLRVICSKGTYIRTLGVELAAGLHSCGYIDRLRRAWVEPFDSEPMVTIEELQVGAREPEGTMRWLLPVDRGIESWPRVDLDADETRRVLDGQVLEMPATSGPSSNVRLYGPLGQFLGIAQLNEQGHLAPRRLISNQRRQ